MPGVGGCGYWTGALGDVEFGVVDADGVAWTWLGLDAWDGPPTSGSLPQRSGDHGGWPGPQFYAARPMTLRASIDAPTQALRDAARARLRAAVPVSELAVLRHDEPTPKQAYVRRSGSLVEDCPNLVSCDVAIGLVAPDPRWYGTDLQSASVPAVDTVGGGGVTPPAVPPLVFPDLAPGGSVAVTNAGNVETRPTVTVTGAISAPTVTHLGTSSQISFPSVTLAAGDALVLDLDLRQARQNGAFRPAAPLSGWWVLEPGDATIQLGGSSDGSAVMTVAWRDAWI